MTASARPGLVLASESDEARRRKRTNWRLEPASSGSASRAKIQPEAGCAAEAARSTGNADVDGGFNMHRDWLRLTMSVAKASSREEVRRCCEG